MKTIYLHQLRDHLKSLRFQVGLAVVAVFFCANGLVYTWKIERLHDENAAIYADVEQRYDDVDDLRSAVGQTYRVVDDAIDTEFIAEGGFNVFWGSYWFAPETGRYFTWYMGRNFNFWLERFELIDWVVIVRYVISFLCIVLAYDAITRERESGTLSIVLANPLSRSRFLLGKYAAHLTSIGVALLLGGTLSVSILFLNGHIELDGRLLVAYAVFFVEAILYASVFLLLAMLVSAVVRDSVSSLVVLVVVWATLIVVVPQSSYLIAMQTDSFPQKWRQEPARYMTSTKERLQREGLLQRQADIAEQDDFDMERRYAQQLRAAEKEQEQLGRSLLDRQLDRYMVARMINLISPGYAFQYSVEAFLGTGVARRQHFIKEANRYRDDMRRFLRDKDAEDRDSPGIELLAAYASTRKVDSSEIPRFGVSALPMSGRLEMGLLPLIVLMIEAGLAFFVSFWAFNRARVVN